MTVTKNDTKGSLLRKLRSAQELEVKGSDETIVGFGRYADMKYKEVPQTYLDWTMEVFVEGPTECSGKLARLAAWAMTQQRKTGESTDEKNMEPTAISSAASSAGTPGRGRKKRAGAAVSTTEVAEDAEIVQPELAQKMEYMMGQMMAGMQKLQTRMIDLETKQQQPRNPDENALKEPTPSQESFKMVYPWPADQLPADCRE